MRAAHTPGPWEVRKYGLPVERQEIEKDASPLAEVFGSDTEPMCWPVSANAKLIAAAPELLAACEAARQALAMLKSSCDEREWREDWHDMPSVLDSLTAAIAKAEGRS